MSPLQGITILDFTRLYPGPLATNLLAQLGARVIRVEHPGKPDLTRRQPPFIGRESTLYQALNFAKEVLSLDYEQEEGREEIIRLLPEVDVVIEQFRPGVMAAWGLAYEHLRAVNPRLIYLSLSGYGQDGPYRDRAGHDLNYLAYSGLLGLNRDPEGRPVIPGVQIADVAGGSYMAMSACLLALLQRERSGRGAWVDVSMLDGLLPLLTIPASQHWGGLDPYQANFLSGGLVNYNVYRCADGEWVALGALELKFWSQFCDLVDKPEWKRQNPLELSVYVFPKSEIETLFLSRSRDEWVSLAEGLDVCLSPVRSLAEVEDDPHIRHRGGVVSFESPEGLPMKGFGVPFKIH